MEHGGAGGGAQAAPEPSRAFDPRHELAMKVAEPPREVPTALDGLRGAVSQLEEQAHLLATRLVSALPSGLLEQPRPSEPRDRFPVQTEIGGQMSDLQQRVENVYDLLRMLEQAVQV